MPSSATTASMSARWIFLALSIWSTPDWSRYAIQTAETWGNDRDPTATSTAPENGAPRRLAPGLSRQTRLHTRCSLLFDSPAKYLCVPDRRSCLSEIIDLAGAPEEIRTPDPQIRSLVLASGGKGMVSHDAAEPRWDVHSPRFGIWSSKPAGTTPNPSLEYAALSSSTICLIVSFQTLLVMCIMHHHPGEWTKKFATHVPAPTFRPVRDAASCHNSSGFLAAPYAGCNSSGILRRADRRSILEARW